MSNEEVRGIRDRIAANVRRLIESAGIQEIFRDIFEKPLSWQVATVGILAALAGEMRVAAWCNSALAAEGLDD